MPETMHGLETRRRVPATRLPAHHPARALQPSRGQPSCRFVDERRRTRPVLGRVRSGTPDPLLRPAAVRRLARREKAVSNTEVEGYPARTDSRADLRTIPYCCGCNRGDTVANDHSPYLVRRATSWLTRGSSGPIRVRMVRQHRQPGCIPFALMHAPCAANYCQCLRQILGNIRNRWDTHRKLIRSQ